jgi:hypothetical protein
MSAGINRAPVAIGQALAGGRFHLHSWRHETGNGRYDYQQCRGCPARRILDTRADEPRGPEDLDIEWVHDATDRAPRVPRLVEAAPYPAGVA